MIEVLVSPNNVGVNGRMGDIVTAGLTGMPWSPWERICFWVAEWDDAELEARLVARQTTANPWPVIGSPYRGTEPTVDVCMLPSETWTPQVDENGHLAVDGAGKPLPAIRDATPVTMDAVLARMPEAHRTALMLATGQAAMLKRMPLATRNLLQGAASPGIDLSAAEPMAPDLSTPMPGPPLRSRVRLDYVRWTTTAGDKVTVAELADKVKFDGQPIQPADLHDGMAALIARLSPPAESPGSGASQTPVEG